MSPRKSDHPPDHATPSADRHTPARGWRHALLVNLPLPILLAAIFPLGNLVEQSLDPYYARILVLIGYNIVLAVSLQLINGFSGQFSLGHAGFMAVGAYLAAYPAINTSADFKDPANTLLFYVALAVVAAIAAGVLYGLFALARLTRRLHPAVPALFILLLIVWLLVDLSRAARVVTGPPPANLVWSRGISGLQSLMSAIVTHGQPAAARLSATIPEALQGPVTFLILLAGAGMCAAATGLIVGLPALRLKGDYLAIATLGMGEIIRIIIINTPALGSALGLTSIPRYADFAWVYAVAILTVFVIWRVAYSAAGRAIMAVREDEIAAAAVGINNTYQKVVAFVIGAFFAGVAGAVFALNEYSITPNRFSMERSIEVVVMVTLGGLGSISGAILAAVVLTLLPEVLRPIAEYRMIIYSLALVIIMILRPTGLLGGRELWPRRRGPRAPSPTTDQHKEALAT